MFGLVCLALAWPRLQQQRWWLWLGGWPRLPVSMGMVAQYETSCWACHVMHKVVALASAIGRLEDFSSVESVY